MNEVFRSEIDEQIQIAKDGARYLYFSLEKVGQLAGFSIAQLVSRGAICADVEYGGEGYALLPFNPPFLILGESETYGDRDEIITGALEAFSGYPVVVKRSSAIKLVRDLDTVISYMEQA